MALHWHLLRIKSRQDKLVFELLAQEQVETLYPTYVIKSGGNSLSRELACFPGYIFVRVDLDATGTGRFDWMPGAHGLVYRGDKPAIVPDQLIDGIRKSMAGDSRDGDQEKEVQESEWLTDLGLDEHAKLP